MFYYFVLDVISIYYMILPFALVASVFITIVIIGCRAIKPESKEFQRPLDRWTLYKERPNHNTGKIILVC